MERGNLVKFLLFGAIGLLLYFFFFKPGNDGVSDRQPLPYVDISAPTERAPEQRCAIQGERFRAELSTQGASLRSVRLTDPKYATIAAGDKAIELVTTQIDSRSPLRTTLRVPTDAPQQVAYNDLDWKLEEQTPKSCTFVYEDAEARLTKTIAATGRPYELSTELTVENRAAEARKHRFAVEQSAWRTKAETSGGHFGLQMSEWLSETVAATTETVDRLDAGDFEPKDFKDPEFTGEGWRRSPGAARWVATSSSYFAKIAIPVAAPVEPLAETLIEEWWDVARFPKRDQDPNYGHVYRSRLAYPEVEVQPSASVTYKVLSYTGPKERGVVAALPGDVSDVIKLGWFAPIARHLIAYLYVLYGLVGSWGWAIVLLTITVRLALFPMSITQIKSAAAMRRLKPEMDALNAKYKGDAAQRGLAIQELWRKNKVTNPVIGCLPVLLQMPVWFALYTALQTAVELYHTPFGPVIPDLSQPGLYYIIPAVLGASSFIQQKLMPPQGDPAQQKMMLYMMPGIFTVMMLFLPAGLGVYMLTNTWLGILQQVGVEKFLKVRAQKKSADGGSTIEVREKSPDAGPKPTPALGKGKARVRG